jgi:hypothetical protein
MFSKKEQAAMTASWTWLIYVASDNNTTGAADDSIKQMIEGLSGGDGKLRVLVQQDAKRGCTRRDLGVPAADPVPLGQVDSGDPKTLLDFINWGIETAPAERYALVLWSHGSNWQPHTNVIKIAQEQATTNPIGDAELKDRGGKIDESRVIFTPSLRTILSLPKPSDRAIAFDDGSGTALDTVQLGAVATAVAQKLSRPLDLLVMNACQMASAEVVYQLRDNVDVYVASEVNMPVSSFPYDDIFPRFVAEPDLTADAVGRMLVERYCAYYRTRGDLPWGKQIRHNPDRWFPKGATLTAVRLGSSAKVADTVRDLAAAFQADMTQQFDSMWNAQITAKDRDLEEFQLYDLTCLCAPLVAHEHASVATKAAAQAVLAALADPDFLLKRDYTVDAYARFGGLTTYLLEPVRGNSLSAFYAQTAYDQRTQWGAMLKAYYDEA